ncbi:Uncharacterised protein [Mycobacteroides abscessus subsp. abscessus]|nr:Uncharacterised protein [Mycobacteroides abscessus subsp. abscessus]
MANEVNRFTAKVDKPMISALPKIATTPRAAPSSTKTMNRMSSTVVIER